ncbi:MAG: pyruvate dehydrogenase complex dihydrolipoyllysine-residue acetyltransferase, partial [Pseudomonadota bacterium]
PVVTPAPVVLPPVSASQTPAPSAEPVAAAAMPAPVTDTDSTSDSSDDTDPLLSPYQTNLMEDTNR